MKRLKPWIPLIVVLITVGVAWAVAPDSKTSLISSGSAEGYLNGDTGFVSEVQQSEARAVAAPVYVVQKYSTPSTANTPSKTAVQSMTPVATPGVYRGCSVKSDTTNPLDICVGPIGVSVTTTGCAGGATWCCSGGWPLSPGQSRNDLDAINGDCSWLYWLPVSAATTINGVTVECRSR